MSTHDARAIVAGFSEVEIDDFAAVEELIVSDFVSHSSMVGEVRGAVRHTYRGSDTGGILPSMPPTSKPFEFTAMYLWPVVDGRLAELWQEADRLRLVQQLGSQAGDSASASRAG